MIRKETQLVGHQNPIYALAVDASQQALFSAGNDRGIVRWDLEELRFDRILHPVQQTVYTLNLVEGRQLLVAGQRDGTVRGVHAVSGEEKWKIDLHKSPVFAVGTVLGKARGEEMVIGSEDGTASVWMLSDKDEAPKALLHWKVSDMPIRCLAVSPNNEWIAFGTKDGWVHVYDARDYSSVAILDAHTKPVTSLLFSPGSEFLISSGRDAQMKVHELPGHGTNPFGLQKDFVPHMFAVYEMQYHPQLPVFATASRDKSVKIWSSEDYRLLRSLSIEKGVEAHRLSVNALCWHPDGRRLFTAGDDKLVFIWNVEGDASV